MEPVKPTNGAAPSRELRSLQPVGYTCELMAEGIRLHLWSDEEAHATRTTIELPWSHGKGLCCLLMCLVVDHERARGSIAPLEIQVPTQQRVM